VEAITEPEWSELLLLLPDDADQVAVRQAVEAAIRDYVANAPRDQRLLDLFRRIERRADSPTVRKLCQDMLELEKLSPDSQTEPAMRQQLTQLRSRAKVRAAVYLSTNRRGRFMSQIAVIWTNVAKGKLPISEGSPFVDFLAAIYERVEGRSLTGVGVKKFVRREKARRDVLNSIKEAWRAEGKMRIDMC
jgi:hypothetical protein